MKSAFTLKATSTFVLLKANTLLSNARRKSGFTLIELLIVIIIISILATFVVASFTTAQKKARDARRKADLDAIKKALELFRSDSPSGRYPFALGVGAGLLFYNTMKTFPTDPLTGGYYHYNPSPIGSGNCISNPGPTPPQYYSDTVAGADCISYNLYACLENGNDTSSGTSAPTGACVAGQRNYTVTSN